MEWIPSRRSVMKGVMAMALLPSSSSGTVYRSDHSRV
jgi:hypothetical protein